MRVLVASTGMWNDRKTLAIVRSLGRAGMHVTVAGDPNVGQPFYSRYCNRRLNLPLPGHDLSRFALTLLRHLRRGRFDVLLPACDYTTLAVAEHADRFSRFVPIPVPSVATLALAQDKWQTLALAQSLSVPIPRSFCPANPDELLQAAHSLSYPCVLKLRKGVGANGLRYPQSAQELLSIYPFDDGHSDGVFDYSRPIVQEYVPGETHDVCMLFNHGRVTAALTQRRILTYPPTGGIGIYNETTHDPALRDHGIRLLEHLHWHGPAQAEFRIDSRSGEPRLMEINTRFWGALDLAIQAGVNFPVLACRMLSEGDVKPIFEYPRGVRYRWMIPYGAAYTLRVRDKLRSLWTFLAPATGVKSDVWLSDPFPHLAEVFWTSPRRLASRLNRPQGSPPRNATHP